MGGGHGRAGGGSLSKMDCKGLCSRCSPSGPTGGMDVVNGPSLTRIGAVVVNIHGGSHTGGSTRV